jgi:hydrophobic/amphiphilic exporter-1 (mainly G- bacteria), HAE1 family
MYLPNLAIRRPILIIMQVAAVLVLGFLSYSRLPVDLMPDISFPYNAVTTIYRGAGAEEIESQVTKKIEDKLSSLAGLKNMTSVSAEGYSMVFLEFTLETNPTNAENDVRQKLAAIAADLPADVDDPIISRFDIRAIPVMTMSVASGRNLTELRTYAEKQIKPRLENIPGVAEIEVIGGEEEEIQIYLDRSAMAAYVIPPQMVVAALAGDNLNLPAGTIKTDVKNLNLRVTGEYKSIDEIAHTVVANRGGANIYLSDIAKIKDSNKEKTQIARLNGEPCVSMVVQKQPTSNTVQTCNEIAKKLNQMKNEIPSDIVVKIINDQSLFVRRSVDDTMSSLILGAIFASLVILIFLGNVRSTIISFLAVPTSIFFTFMCMQMVGFTINMMTLMGLSLVVGILIDDAIVVRENIYRRLELGEAPEDAAKDGTAEVSQAVIATTLTILAVFIPVGFMSGIAGRFFTSFALTICFAVVYSLWDAFTMAPMLSAKIYVKGVVDPTRITLEKRIFGPFDRAYKKLNFLYKDVLHWSLKHRVWVLLIAVFFLAGSCGMLGTGVMGTSFMPNADRGEFQIQLESRKGTSIEEMQTMVSAVEKELIANPAVDNVYTNIGSARGNVEQAILRVSLVPYSVRQRRSEVIENDTRAMMSHQAKLKSAVIPVGMFGGSSADIAMNLPIAIRISGTDLATLNDISYDFIGKLKSIKGLVDLNSSLTQGMPEYRVTLNKDKAASVGVSNAAVAITLRTLVDGNVATRLRKGEDDVDIRVILPPDQRASKTDIEGLYVINNAGQPVLLSSIASIEETVGPATINRINRVRSVSISANYSGRPFGDIVSDIQKLINNTPLPAGYAIIQKGMAEQMTEMFSDMILALILGAIFIYMVLASQFNSFIHPFTIMMSLPLAVVGAFIAIFITGKNLDMMTMIGLILLIGIVNKNAILLVDFIIQRQGKGDDRSTAIMESGSTRLRPILMTTTAMIMGMMPSALALAEGAEFRAPLAIAVIGGLITSTLLTLLVVPVVYTLFDDMMRFFTGKEKIRVE